jgi:hypothetical protein
MFKVGDVVRFGVDQGFRLWGWTAEGGGFLGGGNCIPVRVATIPYATEYVTATVCAVDTRDNSFQTESDILNKVWWSQQLPDRNDPDFDSYPCLVVAEPDLTGPADHIERVTLNSRQDISEKILQAMIDRGESYPRRNLPRWPAYRLWIHDGGQRVAADESKGETQDSYVVSWRWVDEVIKE